MIFLTIFFAAAFLVMLYCILGYAAAAFNYKHNKKYSISHIVNDQSGKTGQNLRFGLFHVKYNGCGPIALHNAKILSGYDSYLEDVIYSVEISKALILFGVFGTSAYAMRRAITREKLFFEPVTLKEITDDGIYIVKYKHDGKIRNGEHFVTVQVKNGKYYTYNLGRSGRVYEASPFEYAKKGYVAGYRITDGNT